MHCSILDWILEQKKERSGKTNEHINKIVTLVCVIFKELGIPVFKSSVLHYCLLCLFMPQIIL